MSDIFNNSQRDFGLFLVLSTIFFSIPHICVGEYAPEIREKLYACGYNSLYLFLHMRGYPADFETLKSNVVIGENGTSFYDLQKGAASVGVRTESVRCSYSALRSVDMPVIAWINKNHQESEVSTIGHFIVLTSVNEDGIIFLDGTSGQKHTMQQDNFHKQWNGMILMEKSKGSFLTDRIALTLFLIGLACIFFRWGFARKHVIPVSLLFLLFHSVSFCQANESTRIWRTQENETINALYLLLKCDNLPCDYAELEAELKSSSTEQNLDILKSQARKRGLQMDVFRCATPDALNRVSIPFLLHAEGGNDINNTEWKGNYLFVMGRGHGHYMILDCGTLVSSEIQEETLRRYWSGFILGKPPKAEYSFFRTPLFISIMIGLGVLFVYLGFRPKKKLDTLKTGSIMTFLVFILSFSIPSQAEENPPKAVCLSDQIKAAILETADGLKSLKVYYRSEYYADPKAPPKTYLYRKILAKSPYYLNHTNSHPCDDFSWDKDPLLQQAFIQDTIGYNIFPFRNCYFVMVHKQNDPLPGTLPGEFFFNATGIWPMESRKAPTWGKIPVALRNVAKNSNYDHVRPHQEKMDDRWCHVFCWPGNDTLWTEAAPPRVGFGREEVGWASEFA